jgi:ribosomal protein L34
MTERKYQDEGKKILNKRKMKGREKVMAASA